MPLALWATSFASHLQAQQVSDQSQQASDSAGPTPPPGNPATLDLHHIHSLIAAGKSRQAANALLASPSSVAQSPSQGDAEFGSTDSIAAVQTIVKLLQSSATGEPISATERLKLAQLGDELLGKGPQTEQPRMLAVLLRTSLARDLTNQLATVTDQDLRTQQTQQLTDLLLQAITDLTDDQTQTPPGFTSAVLDVAMRAAGKCLALGHHRTAEAIYRKLMATPTSGAWGNLTSPSRQLARLGLGWALAGQADRNQEAADALGEFLRYSPSHPDAQNAASLQIECLRRAGKSTDAAAREMIKQWPQSKLAIQHVQQLLAQIPSHNASTPPRTLSAEVASWLAIAPNADRWPIELVAQSLRWPVTGTESDDTIDLLGRLRREDRTGRHTAWLLSELDATARQNATDSATDTGIEHRATLEPEAILVGHLSDPASTVMACEAATRWAARNQRWELLSVAADAMPSDQSHDRWTEHTERLLAEALVQTGQRGPAIRLWRRLVHERNCTDFPTLLRYAECCVAKAPLAEAKESLATATASLEGVEPNDRSQQETLLKLLQGDLFIRNAQFDQARSLYQTAIRDAESSAELRARAQWMVGESYLMQRQYATAIDAYRRVEAMQPNGPFAAIALIQAGKSFEQLGRTRDAVLCYDVLIERFADSRFAGEARKRLASLPTKPLEKSFAPGENQDGPSGDFPTTGTHLR
ncbi:tetratricopeptide repeat protein [Stieleria bergensis]|uniref:tetratricopeptide repeat protein n=1 Tax=Stieleria bergensis TaxID=2528025 RepID=UPI003AF40561